MRRIGFISKSIYQYIKDCEAGVGRTPSVRANFFFISNFGTVAIGS